MRATTRAQLFEQVCEAAVLGGSFASTTILLADPDGKFLHVEAAAGGCRGQDTRLSVDTCVGRTRLNGSAFRSKQPCIGNDYLTDPQ